MKVPLDQLEMMTMLCPDTAHPINGGGSDPLSCPTLTCALLASDLHTSGLAGV